MNEYERMLNGNLYNPYKVNDGVREKNRLTLETFNSLPWSKQSVGMAFSGSGLSGRRRHMTIRPYKK